VAAGRFLPAGSRKGVLPPPFRTPRGRYGFGSKLPKHRKRGTSTWPPSRRGRLEIAAKAFRRLASVPPVGAGAHVRDIDLFPQDSVGRSGMGGLSPAGAAAQGGVGDGEMVGGAVGRGGEGRGGVGPRMGLPQAAAPPTQLATLRQQAARGGQGYRSNKATAQRGRGGGALAKTSAPYRRRLCRLRRLKTCATGGSRGSMQFREQATEATNGRRPADMGRPALQNGERPAGMRPSQRPGRGVGRVGPGSGHLMLGLHLPRFEAPFLSFPDPFGQRGRGRRPFGAPQGEPAPLERIAQM